MQQFINRMFGTLSMALFVVTLLGIIAAPLLIHLFAPGFNHDASRFDLASSMLRITFPYILFISLTAFAAGVLNTHNRFAAAAFTPVLLNVALIASIVFLAPHLHHPITALAWGVFVGGILQLLFQYPFLWHLRIVPKIHLGWHDPGVRRVLKLMIPALFGVSVAQLGLLIDTIFASFLPAGSISWLYNSERLMLFPLGIFGVAIATVVLPHLAKQHSKQATTNYKQTLQWAIRSVLLLGMPAAIGLVMLSGPLLTTLFHYGQFNDVDVIMSQHSLIAYALGVPFMMSVKVLASGFYARQNIKTPVKIAAIALLVNIIFNGILIVPFQHAGLALASALAATVNASLLLYMLHKYKLVSFAKGWGLFLIRLGAANMAMAIVLWLMTASLSSWLTWHWQQRAEHLLIIIVASVATYAASLWLVGLRKKNWLPESR
ncbi:MAG: murein biosynthesis integral membrane protein MurJ [Gammaproteobacteria bacterium]|nr:murein biosynthesis integral membrane protein MurJ [Gammaproteobacteria bacterium]